MLVNDYLKGKLGFPRLLVELRDMRRSHKQILLLMIDLTTVSIAFFLVAVLNTAGSGASFSLVTPIPALGILLSVTALGSWILGLPKVQLKSYEARGMGLSAVLGVIVGIAAWAVQLVQPSTVSGAGSALLACLFIIGSVLARFLMLQVVLALYRIDIAVTNVLIYGAGTTGMQLAFALRPDRGTRVVGFIDDNMALQGVSVAGLPVYPSNQIDTVASQKEVRRVLLAMPSVNAPKMARIARRLTDKGLEVQSLPSFAQLVGEEELVGSLKQALPDAFLTRKALHATLAGAWNEYAGKSLLVSGAGGSIGSELCRQLLLCNPRRLVLLESSEHALYQIHRELEDMNRHTGCTIVPVLGSVTDRRAMHAVMLAHKVQGVLHAAAYKHVPLVEANTLAGIANNLFGTVILARAAKAAGVERFVLVSTDKAVRPESTMGASKRMAELAIADMARKAGTASGKPGTVFCMVRFGNVLGSSGSVIPRFQEQITSGGPLTLTHPDVERYFMTIQEATQLVLRAGAMAQGAEAFVLDMGAPVRVADLARRMIEAAGYTVRDAKNPMGDIEIEITGLRPGEKLSEEISIARQHTLTEHPKIFVAQEVGLSSADIDRALGILRRALARGDEAEARQALMHWVCRDLELLAQQPDHPAQQLG